MLARNTAVAAPAPMGRYAPAPQLVGATAALGIVAATAAMAAMGRMGGRTLGNAAAIAATFATLRALGRMTAPAAVTPGGARARAQVVAGMYAVAIPMLAVAALARMAMGQSLGSADAEECLLDLPALACLIVAAASLRGLPPRLASLARRPGSRALAAGRWLEGPGRTAERGDAGPADEASSPSAGGT